MIATMARRRTGAQGKRKRDNNVVPAFFAAGLGTMVPGFAALRTGTGSIRRIGTTTSVFALPGTNATLCPLTLWNSEAYIPQGEPSYPLPFFSFCFFPLTSRSFSVGWPASMARRRAWLPPGLRSVVRVASPSGCAFELKQVGEKMPGRGEGRAPLAFFPANERFLYRLWRSNFFWEKHITMRYIGELGYETCAAPGKTNISSN